MSPEMGCVKRRRAGVTTAGCGKSYGPKGGESMALLWLLVILLILFAIVGGAAVNSWLFLIILVALILALAGYF
jgi:hypothetical protein